MILIAALVALVLVVGVAVLVGAAGLAGDARRRSGTGSGAAWAVPAAVAGIVVVLCVVAVLGLGGARSGRSSATDDASTARSDERGPVPLEGPRASFDAQVSIDAAAPPLRPLPIVSGLAAGEVVDVEGVGFLDHTEGVIAQCPSREARACRNVATVLTDGAGRLRVPYRVEGHSSGEVLVVEVDFARGAARLSFGSAPSGLTVLTVLDATSVAIHGAPPGERVAVLGCDAGGDAIDECSALGTATIAADGKASVTLDARTSDGETHVALVDAAGNVLAEPVVARAMPPTSDEVDLRPSQLLVGFSMALVLLGVAVALIRTTDWRAPAEAATPFLDAAALDPWT